VVDLPAVRVAVVVGVEARGVGAEAQLLAVGEPVAEVAEGAVGVGVVGIEPGGELLGVAQAVAVGVSPARVEPALERTSSRSLIASWSVSRNSGSVP
jgi:hypothetical protein